MEIFFIRVIVFNIDSIQVHELSLCSRMDSNVSIKSQGIVNKFVK